MNRKPPPVFVPPTVSRTTSIVVETDQGPVEIQSDEKAPGVKVAPENAATVSFGAAFKLAQTGTFTSVEIRVFASDHYEGGNRASRDEVFDGLVDWAEAAIDRQADRFNQWRDSVGHTGTWKVTG